MNDMTPYTINDYCYSATARFKGIDNRIPQRLLKNAYYTLDCINDVASYVEGFRLTSGYRCPELNKAVRGASRSKHLDALAFDFACDDLDAAIDFIMSRECPFTPSYVEQRKTYIHISI